MPTGIGLQARQVPTTAAVRDERKEMLREQLSVGLGLQAEQVPHVWKGQGPVLRQELLQSALRLQGRHLSQGLRWQGTGVLRGSRQVPGGPGLHNRSLPLWQQGRSLLPAREEVRPGPDLR